MGAYIAVGAASIVLIVMVVVLSLMTINKGYSYKHSIDPLPDEAAKEAKQKQEN